MAIMTIRTSVAFDPATVARWEKLSKRWGVSKSEALRRRKKTFLLHLVRCVDGVSLPACGSHAYESFATNPFRWHSAF